nr:hypothetical protein [Tanacetum cinerariifolium]
KANVQCYNCNEKGHYARKCQKSKVLDSKYFREQMLFALKDEAKSNLNSEENDFMLDTSYGEKLEELTAAAQHQNEIIEMFNDVTQKTYAYANVRAQNQDLLMRISELKIKLQMNDKGKHVNTKFDKSKTLGQLLYVTSFNKNLAIKAKNVSNTKMKPKADIGIFVGYSESSCGFRIYNRQTKKIIEMIHAKFDELMAMGSECNNLEPKLNYKNFKDSLEDSQSVPSTSNLDNLFGPMYDEYYTMSSQEVFDNSTANNLNNDHTSSSSIIIDKDDAPPIVVSLKEQVVTEPNSLVLNEVADEFI